jgi:hypothetical protein
LNSNAINTNTPELFVELLENSFTKSDSNLFNNLLINKEDLVEILINEDSKLTYQYSDKLFRIASDKTFYLEYIKQTVNAQQKIRNNINKLTEKFEETNYSVSNNGLELTGILVLNKNQTKTDSIKFAAVKIHSNWFLESIAVIN